jgi:hypothetical protein
MEYLVTLLGVGLGLLTSAWFWSWVWDLLPGVDDKYSLAWITTCVVATSALVLSLGVLFSFAAT